jgi:viroplasmin and RNaseH domain-containing protein
MMKTVWIYENGDTLKTFDTEEEAQTWLDEHHLEGVAFEHEVSGGGIDLRRTAF